MSSDEVFNKEQLLEQMESARSEFLTGNYAAAEPLFRDSLQSLGDEPELLAESVSSLSEIYTSWGKFSEAEQLNQQLIDYMADMPGEHNEHVSASLERNAYIYEKLGQDFKSEEMNRKALAVKEGRMAARQVATPKEAPKEERAGPPPVAPIPHPGKIVQPPAQNKQYPAQAPAVQQDYQTQAPSSRPPVARPPQQAPSQRPAAAQQAPPQRPHSAQPQLNAPSQHIPQQRTDVPQQRTGAPPVPHQMPPQRPKSAQPDSSPTILPGWGDSPAETHGHQQQSREQKSQSGWGNTQGWGQMHQSSTPPAGQSSSGQSAPHASPSGHTASARGPGPSAPSMQAPSVQSPSMQSHSMQSHSMQQSGAGQEASATRSFEMSTQPGPGQAASQGEASAESVSSQARQPESRLRDMSSRESPASSGPRGFRGGTSDPGMNLAPDSGGGFSLGKIAYGAKVFFSGRRAIDEPVQQIVDPEVRSRNAAISILAMVAIFIVMGLASYHLLPRKLTAAQAFRSIPHKYRSADLSKIFGLVDPHTAEFVIERNRMRYEYKFYLDDWRDAIDVALGTASQKQVWFFSTKSGIIDHDRNMLYVAEGPESKLTGKVEMIEQYATLCYLKDRKYPDKGDLLSAFNLEYENPYTKEKESPVFDTVDIGEELAANDADKARSKFYNDLLFGKTWEGATEGHPGMIRCGSVTFHNPRGNIQAFVIQILGADGKLLSGSSRGTYFIHALEDGKGYKIADSPQFPFKGQSGMRPIVIWVFLDSLDPNFDFLVKNGPALIFSVLSFIFLALAFVVPSGLGRFVVIILLLLSAAPAAIFGLSKWLP